MAGARKKREKLAYHKKSLQEQIEDPDINGVRTHPRNSKRKRADEDENELLSAKLSGRILKAAREQQEEIDAEDAEEERAGHNSQINVGALAAALKRVVDSDEDEDQDDDHLAGSQGWHDADSVHNLGDVEVDPEDERALAAFMASGHQDYKQLSLGDLVLSKLREKQQAQGISVLPEDGDEEPVPQGLDDKVVEVYRGVGKLLSRFTTGKIPKAFKIIPNLKNWEEVLYLTEPDLWSPHAMYEATKIFVSNLNARLAQRFLALVLLPRIRRDIKEQHKLHFALFMALKKATYKPGAFYKGLLLPLCQSRTCTLREAFIFSSVLKRVSIPVLHSAAALLRMAEMEYCGTTSFFIRTLLDKKYALPYRVIDALVDHFVRFVDDERQMPVVWHQCLLCFVQRYKDEIRPEDMDALRKLCTAQRHYQVTPEVLRELDHGRARGSRASGVAAMEVQAHIGKNVAENINSLPPVPMMDDE